jgi:hypothetical protein
VTTVGEEVPVYIWFMGPPNPCCCVFAASLCNADSSLAYESTQYYSPGGGWGFPPVSPPDAAGCIVLQGQDLSFGWMCFPWRIAKVTYQAATDQAIAELVLGQESGILTTSFQTVYFANNGEVIARIQIGDVTATETTSWGAVKALFR